MTQPTREELEAKGFIEVKETGLWIDGSLIERPEDLVAAVSKFIMADRKRAAGRLETVMQKFYDKEQNILIKSFWDADWTAEIGSYQVEGWRAEHISPLCKVGELAEWLEEKYVELFPA